MTTPRDDIEMEVEHIVSDSGGRTASMEAMDTEKGVMASGTTGSVTCSLHPLVIMNVSEHWTRERAQEGAVQQGSIVFLFLIFKE